MNIFVSGINQGSGKTLISAGITAVLQSLGYKTGVYKPVQTGSIIKGKYIVSPDLSFVRSLDRNIMTHATYMLTSNTIPAAAAEIENIDIKIDDIENDYNILSKNNELLITEGTGGLLTPFAGNLFNFHIPLALNLPVVFVVTPSNDNLNILLNELGTAYKTGLDVIGVIINNYPHKTKNAAVKTFPKMLQRFCSADVLGRIHTLKNKNVQPDELFEEILNGINIQEILRMEIPKLK